MAHELKRQREAEEMGPWAGKGEGTTPAPSLKRRQEIEARKETAEEVEAWWEEQERRTSGKRRRKKARAAPSPTPEVERPRRRRDPPTGSDEEPMGGPRIRPGPRRGTWLLTM